MSLQRAEENIWRRITLFPFKNPAKFKLYLFMFFAIVALLSILLLQVSAQEDFLLKYGSVA